jgi:hypothetical protein
MLCGSVSLRKTTNSLNGEEWEQKYYKKYFRNNKFYDEVRLNYTQIN